MENVNIFSERLREIMFDKDNIKPDKLGQIIGVSGQAIRAWLDGSHNICLSNMVKLANYFNCSIDFLVGFSEEILDFTPQECPPFYTRFREVLKEKKITRYRLVKETTIKDSYFTTWQNGAEPNILSLMEVAKYIECSLDYLIGREK